MVWHLNILPFVSMATFNKSLLLWPQLVDVCESEVISLHGRGGHTWLHTAIRQNQSLRWVTACMHACNACTVLNNVWSCISNKFCYFLREHLIIPLQSNHCGCSNECVPDRDVEMGETCADVLICKVCFAIWILTQTDAQACSLVTLHPVGALDIFIPFHLCYSKRTGGSLLLYM